MLGIMYSIDLFPEIGLLNFVVKKELACSQYTSVDCLWFRTMNKKCMLICSLLGLFIPFE